MPTEQADTVRTSETTLLVIEALEELGTARVIDVADHLDVAKSTALRHLKTLEQNGYLVKTNGQYKLGTKLLTLGSVTRNEKLGYRLAEEYVDQLANVTNERAQFMIEENGERVFLYRRVPKDAVRGNSNIGKRGLMHGSAGGKAILAALSDQRIEEIIQRHGLPKLTESTITDEEELFDEIETIRDQGFAINREETAPGFHAVGAAVSDLDGDVLGALSVAGPSHRLNMERIQGELPELVLGTAQELELKIEYYER